MLGWGLGLAVHLRQRGIALAPGSCGWDGGLGTSWATDPTNRLIGVLLTNRTWSSPVAPPVTQDFWTGAATAMR